MVGTYCCIPGCKSNTSKNTGLKFHKFPTQPDLRKLWIDAINNSGPRLKYMYKLCGARAVFSPKKSNRVCGKHFVKEKMRFDNSVPSIFSPCRDKVKRRLLLSPKVGSQSPKSKMNRSPFKENESSLTPTKYQTSTPLSFSNETELTPRKYLASTPNYLSNQSPVKPVMCGNSDKGESSTSKINDAMMKQLETDISETSLDTGKSTDFIGVGLSSKDINVSSSENQANQKSADCSAAGSSSQSLFITESRVWDEKYKELHKQIAELESTISLLKLQNKNFECLVNESQFRIENLDEEKLKFYTGVDKETFDALFELLEEDAEKLLYWKSTTQSKKSRIKPGKPRALNLRNELLLVLIRLRQGLLVTDLAYRFQISPSTVSRIFITWIDFLCERFDQLPIWPSKDFIKETMPQCFEDHYPDTRIILDCTEIFVEKPSCFRTQSETYSPYKSHNSAKGLVGVSPAGLVSYISHLAPGRLSDRKITERSGLIDLLEEGDSVMADKGFLIEDLLSEKKVTLNIPPFLRGADQLTKEQEEETRKIASLRIHVERTIRRIKCFRILKFTVPATMTPDLNKIWRVCCHLVNISSDPVTVSKNYTDM